MNRDFGKLADGRITYAPRVVMTEAGLATRPTAADYLAAGYKRIIDTPPPVEAGGFSRPSGWLEAADTITRRYETVAAPPPAPRVFSKLKCHLALKAAGHWPAVKAWLEANDLWDAFLLAQDVREDDEQFTAGVAALKASLGLSDDDVEKLLAACVLEGA
ncbi:MAG: hypothetical protein ACI4RA_05565 [Kiritimatiellia bacterium]